MYQRTSSIELPSKKSTQKFPSNVSKIFSHRREERKAGNEIERKPKKRGCREEDWRKKERGLGRVCLSMRKLRRASHLREATKKATGSSSGLSYSRENGGYRLSSSKEERRRRNWSSKGLTQMHNGRGKRDVDEDDVTCWTPQRYTGISSDRSSLDLAGKGAEGRRR